MDPDHATTDEYRCRDASPESRSIPLSHRPHLSYTTEIEGINDTLPITEQWVETLDSIATYFDTFKQDFVTASVTTVRSRVQLLDIVDCLNEWPPRCLRDGGPGEGEEEFELFRHRLCDYSRL